MPSPFIKICGLSTPETFDAAIDAGATHVGLVHFEPSPRHVDLAQAAALRRRAPTAVKVVLLLVNADAMTTAQALDLVRPDVVQFHGRETPEWLGALKQKLPFEIWKALGVRNQASFDKAVRFRGAADRLIYDAPAKALPGGNGLALDWDLLRHRPDMPWGLAGGLTPDNVADAIRQTGAPLVDTSSGVEREPGVKDKGKIRAFVEAARAAG